MVEPGQKAIVAFGLGRLLCEVLTTALSSQGWHVVKSDQQQTCSDQMPEIVLVFSSGRAEDIIDEVHCAHAQFPHAKIVLLAAEATEGQLVRFVKEGVCAWIFVDQSLSDLVNALHMVDNDRSLSSGRIMQLVFSQIKHLSRERETCSAVQLTLREEEVLSLIKEGLSNKEMASRLGVSQNTVKNHVHHLLEKLNVNSRHKASCIQLRPSSASFSPRRLEQVSTSIRIRPSRAKDPAKNTKLAAKVSTA
jgi:DNA-binding NarL/FixJ family response regulator